jgi:hypothetical protein
LPPLSRLSLNALALPSRCALGLRYFFLFFSPFFLIFLSSSFLLLQMVCFFFLCLDFFSCLWKYSCLMFFLQNSKTHVAHMAHGDFFGSEKSFVFPKKGSVKIEFTGENGEVKVLKENLSLLAGEVISHRNENDSLRSRFDRVLSSGDRWLSDECCRSS